MNTAANPSPVTGEEVGLGRSFLARVEPILTPRQFKFLEMKILWPYPASAKCARAAGYSESVARKADEVIVRQSPVMRRILAKWDEISEACA